MVCSLLGVVLIAAAILKAATATPRTPDCPRSGLLLSSAKRFWACCCF